MTGYRLLSVLSRGSRSTVQLVADAEGREWALKRLQPGAAAEKEWALFGVLPEHPGLLLPSARGRDADGPWIASEYCPGGDLAARLAREGALPADGVIAILRQVLGALAALHPRRVHRDLSPANLLFDASGRVRLADFGCLLESGRLPDIPADGLGTPAYADPRQLLGGPADPASDLYALGSICYECLAGAPPYAAESSERMAADKLRGRPRPLAEAAPGVPEPLVAVVEGLMTHGRQA